MPSILVILIELFLLHPLIWDSSYLCKGSDHISFLSVFCFLIIPIDINKYDSIFNGNDGFYLPLNLVPGVC